MRLSFEVFGLELALTFGPVEDELVEDDDDAASDEQWLDVMRGDRRQDHVGGQFDPAPPYQPDYVEPDERVWTGFGFAPSGW